jgi:WD40 repeat protein
MEDQLVTVDLVEGKLWQFTMYKITNLWDFAPGFVIIENHCGTVCETFGAYSYSGEKIWGLPWATAGLFDTSTDKSRLINTGRSDTHIDTLTIEEIDLMDGSMDVIWSLDDWSESEYFTLFFPPALSADEQYISFSLGGEYSPKKLMVIDRSGEVLADVPYGVFPIWGRGLEIVYLLFHFDEDINESLIYYNIEEDRFITLLDDIGPHSRKLEYYPEMVWSPDKKLFAYMSLDEARGVTELFVWDPALGESVLVYTEESDRRVSNLTWSPDSSRLYFSTRKGLLAYQVADQSLVVIALAGD